MIEAVTFSLTDAQRREVFRALREGWLQARQRLIFAVVGWVWIAGAIVRLVATALLQHAFTFEDRVYETLYLTGGLIFFIGTRAMLAYAVARSREAYPVELHVGDDGIRLVGRSSTRVVSWKRVGKVDETPSAFVMSTPFHPIVIPKDVFADGGAALRAAFDDALVGRRLLARASATATLP